MKARSAHNKGKRMEKFVLDYIRENLDAHAYHPKGSGNGEEKGDVYLPNHDVVIEVKNAHTVKIAAWWDQTEEQAHNQTPCLIFRHPRYGETKKTLAVIYFEDYVELLKNQTTEVQVESQVADYEVRDAVTKLESSLRSLKKKFGL
jgi:hypothetical protein